MCAAYSLFTRTLRVLAGDRVAPVEWGHLLILVIKLIASRSHEEPLRAGIGYRWGQPLSVAESLLGAAIDLGPRAERRLNEAIGLWENSNLRQDLSDLSHDLSLAVATYVAKLGQPFAILGPRTAELAAHMLGQPEHANALLAYGDGCGEVIAAVAAKCRREGLEIPPVQVIEARESLRPLVLAQTVIAVGELESLRVKFLDSTHELPDACWSYVNLIDSQYDFPDLTRRLEFEKKFAGRALNALPPGGRALFAVPAVFLNGTQWSDLVGTIMARSKLRAVAQFPRSQLLTGTVRFGLVLTEFDEGVSYVDQTVVLADFTESVADKLNLAQEMEALKSHLSGAQGGIETDRVWVHRLTNLERERLDPAFYRLQRNIKNNVKVPWVSLGSLAQIRTQTEPVPEQAMLLNSNSTSGWTVSESKGPRSQGIRARPGEIVLSVKGSVGKVTMVPESQHWIYASSACAVIATSPRLDGRYLAALLASNLGVQLLATITKGSVRPFIPKHALMELMIPVPPLADQERLADQATALYAAARALRKQAEEKENEARKSFDFIVAG